MTHRSSNQAGPAGTFILDRVFPGLGRIRRASGTMDRRVFDALNTMLSSLWTTARHDYLEAIRDGHLKPLYVLGQLTGGRSVATLPRPADLRPLRPLTDAWLTALAPGPKRYATEYLATFSSRLPDPTLAGLPDALRDYRVMLADRPTQFNRTKYVFQAFLRVTVGTRHGLYLDVVDVPKLREVKATGHPFTPAELSALTKTLTQPYAAMCWTMALTGMGLKEYWGRWSVVGDRVEIHGTKTASRERVVPVCGELVRPGSAVSTFRRLFRPAAPGHTPYDLRRSFAHWLELAGIPQTRQDIYQGHGPRTVSDRYRWHAVGPYLGEDGQRMRAWLREQGAAGLAVVG